MTFKTTKTTMKQVAELASVSTATVARVLHENGYVSDYAREKVLEAISATGYQLNTVAQSLRQQKTHTIAHILESTAPNPFYVHVALGARAMAQQYNYHVLDYNVQHDPQFEKAAVESFISRRVCAIIFTTPIDEENVQLALDAGIPTVQVERPRLAEVDSILVDNYFGSVQAIEHLIEYGHHHIAYLGSYPDTDPSIAGYPDRERYQAYVDTLNKKDLPVLDQFVAFGEIYSQDQTVSVGRGRELTLGLLNQPVPPTAIFISSDNAACGAMQAIYESGLRVPDDISVVSYDDTYASYLSPALTTVRMPMMELGEQAVRVALERIEENETMEPTKIITLKTELIIRNSTKRVHDS